MYYTTNLKHLKCQPKALWIKYQCLFEKWLFLCVLQYTEKFIVLTLTRLFQVSKLKMQKTNKTNLYPEKLTRYIIFLGEATYFLTFSHVF